MMEEINLDKMNLFKRMSAITTEMSNVHKNLNVDTGVSGKYKAVGERDILDAVKPLEAKYGVYSYPYERKIVETSVMENSKGAKKLFVRFEITYRFVNVDNPSEFIDIMSYGDGVDSQDKAVGKGMTYGDKYALMKAYKISTGDDPDQNPSEEMKAYNRYSPSPRQVEEVKKCYSDEELSAMESRKGKVETWSQEDIHRAIAHRGKSLDVTENIETF